MNATVTIVRVHLARVVIYLDGSDDPGSLPRAEAMESLFVSTLQRILAQRGSTTVGQGRRPWEAAGDLGSRPVEAVEAIAVTLLDALAAEVHHA